MKKTFNKKKYFFSFINLMLPNIGIKNDPVSCPAFIFQPESSFYKLFIKAEHQG